MESFNKKIREYIKEKNLSERKVEYSPSGKYELEILSYKTGKSTWDYTRGIVRRNNDLKVICDIARNCSKFDYSFVEKEKVEYFLCGTSYMNQTIVNLETGEVKTHEGDGFCWVPSSNLSPDGKTLVTSGCYWSAPYEVRFWDFTDPMNSLKHLPLEGHEKCLGDYCGYGDFHKKSKGWVGNDVYSYLEFEDSFFIPLQKFTNDITIEELDLFPTSYEDSRNFDDVVISQKDFKRNGNKMELISEKKVQTNKENEKCFDPSDFIGVSPTLIEIGNEGPFEKGTKLWVLNPNELDLKNLDISQPIFHRDNDLPAIEWFNGAKYWYKFGELHRDSDNPAKKFPNGTKCWYKKGKLHRDGDKPAIEEDPRDDYRELHWYKDGLRHREGDKPAIIRKHSESWFKNGKLHRDGNKPSIVWDNG